MRIFYDRRVRIILAAALVIALAAAGIFLFRSAIFERSYFNSHSRLIWGLGEKIEGVASPEDGAAADIKHYEWFSSDYGMGFINTGGNTTYYLSCFPSSHSGFRVTKIVSSDEDFSFLGVRVGDSVEQAEQTLLEAGYSMTGGRHSFCKAVKGHITIEFQFANDEVIEISASLD